MTEIEVTEELRETVRRELPEIEQITDPDLRDKVVEAWAMALAEQGLSGISNIQGSGGHNNHILKDGTQVDHLRGVALLALRMADQLMELKPELPVRRDIVVAGALVHDVGKAYEFLASNQEKWQNAPHLAGWPPARHSVHGWHLCKSVGLSDDVAHIAIGHSKEGVFKVKSLECTIVSHADHAYWQILKAGGLLEDAYGETTPA